jgi:hypothetical protein
MKARRITLALVVLLGLALISSGCALKKKTTGSSSKTSEAASTKSSAKTDDSSEKAADTASSTTKKTASVTETKSDAITAPASGSKERTALLNAARAKLNSNTQMYVYQLYEQGDTALGDLKPLTTSAGERSFYAFTRSGGKWKVTKSWVNGSSSATSSKVRAALPAFSKELVAKINWSAKESSSAGSKKSSSTVKSELSSAAKGWAKTAMDGQGSPYSVVLSKVAKDGNGTWWGRAIVEPTGSYERIEFWAKYGSSWSGKAQDPEPPAPSSYFPSSVISALGL